MQWNESNHQMFDRSPATAHAHQLEQVVILNGSNERRGTIMSLKGAYTIDKHYYPEGGWAWVVCVCALYIQCIAQLLQWSALPMMCARAAITELQIDPDTQLPVVTWPACALRRIDPIRPQLIQQLVATLILNSFQFESVFFYQDSSNRALENDVSSKSFWPHLPFTSNHSDTLNAIEWLQTNDNRTQQAIDDRWLKAIQSLNHALTMVTNQTHRSMETAQAQEIKSARFIKSILFNLSKFQFCF